MIFNAVMERKSGGIIAAGGRFVNNDNIYENKIEY
jgi:hypothetical protein